MSQRLPTVALVFWVSPALALLFLLLLPCGCCCATCQQVDVAVLAPERPVTPSDVDEQLAKLNAELDSQSANGSSTTPASSLVNKAMEVSGWMWGSAVCWLMVCPARGVGG